MKVEIFTITYNEEVILPYFIKWYRERFPDCKITVYDNESTDGTLEIAKNNNCEVISYNSGNTIRDDLYLEIKNKCWKNSNADWVIIVDADEFLDVTEEKLKNADFNIIKSFGYDMCGEDGNVDLIDSGCPSHGYSKTCCFKPAEFIEIYYKPGAHSCNPIPVTKATYNKEQINLLHFKWISLEYGMSRYKLFNSRLSSVNKKMGWGIHYAFSDQVQINYYNQLKANKIKVR